jgi:U2 small nuclear ribonucleoprotein B''
LPEVEREEEPEETTAAAAGFGAAPAKAVPVNAPDATKGQKRGRDEEEEEDDDGGSEMDVSDDSD